MGMRKYKVLFADDEYWTREKIRRIIPWEKYALEFLQPAADGEEVLERIRLEQPDILITDINMPYINGVELLKKVQELHPEIITFVISGYDDFSYVRDSFMAGSINYLVKPVGKIDLVNALSKALEIIGERQARMEEQEKQLTAMQKAASFIQDREFSQFLEARTVPESVNMALNNHMEFVGASLILVKLHDLQDFVQLYDKDMNLLSLSIKKRLCQIAGDEKILIFNHVYRANEFLIVAEIDEEKTARLTMKIMNDLSAATACPITIIESPHKYSLETLHEAYVQDISGLMLRTFGKKNVIMRAKELSGRENIINRIQEAHRKEILSCLKGGRFQDLKKLLFEEIGLGSCEKQGWTYLEVRQTLQRFVYCLLEYSLKNMDASSAVDAQSMLEIADKAAEHMDEKELCETMTEIMEFFVHTTQTEAADSICKAVHQAAEYVEEHYHENLSLAALSEQFHVESSYFSRMFRKETGDNLMLFICKKRMEKALEYMKESDKNLTEIAFMVGYDDYTYFNKVFRKMVGVSPREYKNSLLKEQK